jgi:hypothetical protein
MSQFVFCKSEPCRKWKSRIDIKGKPIPKHGAPALYKCVNCKRVFLYESADVRSDETEGVLAVEMDAG